MELGLMPNVSNKNSRPNPLVSSSV
jgi:hypothetical protein